MRSIRSRSRQRVRRGEAASGGPTGLLSLETERQRTLVNQAFGDETDFLFLRCGGAKPERPRGPPGGGRNSDESRFAPAPIWFPKWGLNPDPGRSSKKQRFRPGSARRQSGPLLAQPLLLSREMALEAVRRNFLNTLCDI